MAASFRSRSGGQLRKRHDARDELAGRYRRRRHRAHRNRLRRRSAARRSTTHSVSVRRRADSRSRAPRATRPTASTSSPTTAHHPPRRTPGEGTSINRAAQIGLWRDGASFHGLDQLGAISAAPTITGPTTDTADTLVLWLVWQFAQNVTAPPSGFIGRLDDVRGVGVYMADSAFAATGATGSLAGTLAASTRHLVSTLAIRPLVVASATPSRFGLLGVG